MIRLLFRITIFSFAFWYSLNALGQSTENTISVEGTIVDSITEEPIAGVIIKILENKKSVATDAKGTFALKLLPGKYNFSFSMLGYASMVKEYDLKGGEKIKILLRQEAKQMDEVTVTAEKSKKQVETTGTGTFQLSRKEIGKLPVLLGETDFYKAIQLMPGIQTTGEGNAAIYVRGGGYDQNLVILDNAPVYNPTHLLGFYSVFNSDVIGNVKVIKSGIPAEYGNRLSSVLEFSTLKDIPEKTSVKGNIGLLSSRLGVEIPLMNHKVMISVSARKTYLNTLLAGGRKTGLIRHRNILYKSGYDFYDFNGITSVQLNSKNKLSLGIYKGKDIFELNSEVVELSSYMKWGNDIASLTWNKIFNSGFYMENSLISSGYKLNMDLSQSGYNFNLISSIRDYGFKNKFTWLYGRHKVNAGIAITHHNIAPNTSKASSDSLHLNLGTVNRYYSAESSAFLADEVEITKKLSAYLGLRYNYFVQFGPFADYTRDNLGTVTDTLHYSNWQKIGNYGGIDYRTSFRYLFKSNLSVKLSFNSNQQYLHLVNASSITFPTDFWISSSGKVKPQQGYQWAAGIFHFNSKFNIETSVEVYYKTFSHQIEFYKGILNAVDNSTFDENLIYGKGRAYGTELLIKKTKGVFTGWIGYTLSKTEKSFPEIEEESWFPAKYDRPHDLSVVANYNAGKKWSFSVLFVYATGSTYTPVVGRGIIAGNIVNEYGRYNSARMPVYHRCDVAATLQLKKTDRIDSRLIFSVYNLYNRQNPFFVYPQVTGNLEHYTLDVSPKEVSIFPVLPSISWEFTF